VSHALEENLEELQKLQRKEEKLEATKVKREDLMEKEVVSHALVKDSEENK